MFKIDVLASSSKGNCYVVSCGDKHFMIECGIPIRDISQKLLKLWLNFNDIEFCLISHKDKDHSLCAKEIASRGIKLIGPDYKNIDCFIEWPKQGMANPQVTTQIVSEQYNSHLLSRQTAIRRPNPEWSDKEVEEELKRIEAEENQTSEETTDDEVTEVA